MSVSPSWSEAGSIYTLNTVAAGATVRVVVNAKNKFGASLFIRAMRLVNNAPNPGLYIAVRRILKGTPAGGGAGVDIAHPQPLFPFQDSTTGSNLTTLTAAPTIPGATVALATGTGFGPGSLCGITDSVTTPTVIEFCRASKLVSSNLTMDRNLVNSGIGNSNTITNNAIILPPIDLAGVPDTAEIEIIFDNGAEAAVKYAIEVWQQNFDSVG